MNHCMGFSWETGGGVVYSDQGWAVSAERLASTHLECLSVMIVDIKTGGLAPMANTNMDCLREAIICDALGCHEHIWVA